MNIDLRDYILDQDGPWLQDDANRQADQLILSAEGDKVFIGGFLRIHVSFQLRNITVLTTQLPQPTPSPGNTTLSSPASSPNPLTTAAGLVLPAFSVIPKTFHFNEVDRYDLTIPTGEVWPYILSARNVLNELGSNAGYRVVISLAGPEFPTVTPVKTAADLPCDFATANIPDTGRFFPSGCEPCSPGFSVGLPPGCGTSLAVAAAPGGCVRPRFFNGMLITREDMEAELLYLRLKNKLHNRASGSGVVWGLDVGRSGDMICVLPGYAVDCCGNDLTVTTPYKVPIRNLLCDPALAGNSLSRAARCFSLLLEYAECPEHPRPVHGDVCSPQATRCEMARIRETVRLRLVPTRSFQAESPIATFLDTVKSFQGGTSIGPGPTPVGAAATGQPPSPLPFLVTVQALQSNFPQEPADTISLQPRPDAQVQQDSFIFEVKSATLQVQPQGGLAFSTGDVFQTFGPNGPIAPPTKVNPTTRTPSTSSFNTLIWNTGLFEPSQEFGATRECRFQFQDWRLTLTDGTQLLGTTEVQLLLTRVRPQNDRTLDLRMTILASAVEVFPPSQPSAQRPCFGEPCCSDQGPLFPTIPPFLDPDPLHPGQPGDPRALALAVLYAVLATEAARPVAEQDPKRLQQAIQIYQAGWKALYAIEPGDRFNQATTALRDLLAAWCKGFLYPGPHCDGEPHGVVIGCVRVAAGTLQQVDPWGGRRYVVHYPLLEHWGIQLGLLQPDLIVSRLVSVICCVAGLRSPFFGNPDQRAPAGVVVLAQPPPEQTGVVNLGNAIVLHAAPQEFDRRLAAIGVQPVRTETLSAADFVSRVVAGLHQPASGIAAGTPVVRYIVAGLPQVSLLAPVPTGTATTTTAAPTSDPARLSGLVRGVLAARTGRDAVPPLLRDATERLVVGLLNAMPLANIVGADNSARDPLVKERSSTVGAVLAMSPETLLLQALGGREAPALNDLITAGESAARTATDAAAGVVVKFGQQKQLTTGNDLQKPDISKAFNEDLTRTLAAAKLKVPAKAVSAAIATASGGKPSS